VHGAVKVAKVFGMGICRGRTNEDMGLLNNPWKSDTQRFVFYTGCLRSVTHVQTTTCMNEAGFEPTNCGSRSGEESSTMLESKCMYAWCDYCARFSLLHAERKPNMLFVVVTCALTQVWAAVRLLYFSLGMHRGFKGV
jgi:hypothetical protein